MPLPRPPCSRARWHRSAPATARCCCCGRGVSSATRRSRLRSGSPSGPSARVCRGLGPVSGNCSRRPGNFVSLKPFPTEDQMDDLDLIRTFREHVEPPDEARTALARRRLVDELDRAPALTPRRRRRSRPGAGGARRRRSCTGGRSPRDFRRVRQRRGDRRRRRRYPSTTPTPRSHRRRTRSCIRRSPAAGSRRRRGSRRARRTGSSATRAPPVSRSAWAPPTART